MSFCFGRELVVSFHTLKFKDELTMSQPAVVAIVATQ